MRTARNTTGPAQPTGAVFGYEAELWKMADALRGSMNAAEYKHVVLGLIFLKYISDAFEEQRAQLEAERSEGADPEDPDEYCAKRHPGEILLVNASRLFAKGRPKNHPTEEHIAIVADSYHRWTAENALSAIITKEEVARNDYNLSPSRYVATDQKEDVLPLKEATVLLREAEEERTTADRELAEVRKALGLGDFRAQD